MLICKLPAEMQKILDSVPSLIEKTFPMPGRFRRTLPSQIAELSRLLTGGRGDRSLSYLSRPNFLSAYLRYFLPWNLYRLCRLFTGLDLPFSAGDVIVDLGSGPLTLVSALWIAYPGLRSLPLEFYCIDRCAPALEAGKKFFTAICSAAGSDNSISNPWKIHLVREDINIRTGANVTRKRRTAPDSAAAGGKATGGKVAMVSAVNMFNEIYESLPHNNGEALRRTAVNIAQYMHDQAAADAYILTVEPGVPQSGHFISFLRSAFMEMERSPLSPCPHTTTCPFADGKKRWCHFAFETTDVSKELRRLSAAAGIPKERLVLSFLLTGPAAKTVHTPLAARVISDAFPLPNNRFGRYSCSALGLVLLTGGKSRIEKIVSGSLIPIPAVSVTPRDAKSGALLVELQ